MPICFVWPVRHGGELLHMAPAPLRLHWMLHPQGLFLRTFNICYCQVFGLTQGIWAIYIGSFNLMILMETNITNQAYLRNNLGYDMVCFPDITTSVGGAQKGLGLVVWDQPQGWSIELMRFHGLNVVSTRVSLAANGLRSLAYNFTLPPRITYRT